MRDSNLEQADSWGSPHYPENLRWKWRGLPRKVGIKLGITKTGGLILIPKKDRKKRLSYFITSLYRYSWFVLPIFLDVSAVYFSDKMLWPDCELWPIPLGSTITPINWRLHLQKEMMIPLISHISYGFSQWMGQPILKSLGWRTTREQIDQPFKCLNFDKNKDTVFSLVVQVTVIRVQCTCIYIYLEEPLGFFFCPQRLGSRIGTFTRKFAKLGRFTYCICRLFLSQDVFLCSDIILCLGIFTRKLRRKNPESRRKKTELGGILFEPFFCTEQHDKTIQQKLSASAFFWGLGIYSGNRQKSNAYRQVRHFFLPRGVCMSYTHLPLRRWQSSNLL